MGPVAGPKKSAGPGVLWYGVVWWYGVDGGGLVWYGVVWCGLVGLVWFGVVWWCGLVGWFGWFGVAWCGVILRHLYTHFHTNPTSV